jgi:neutral ceramidase
MILSAGVARKNISPPPGIYLIGYGNRTKGNLGEHDELTATALVLDDGLHRAVIVACDLLAINEHTVARIQAQTGSNVVICCSHTHSGPITYAGQRSPKKNRGYVNFLVKQIVSAVKESQSNLQPARLTWAQGEADIAVNRRERKPDGHIEIGVNTDGPIDRSLSVVQIQALDGKPITTVVNFQCHGTVLGPNNLLVSADWMGAMRRRVEQVSGAPVMFIQGATGDLNPDPSWGEDDFSVVEAIGLRIAEQVEQELRLLESLSGETISFQHEQVWLSSEAEAHGPTPPPTYRAVLAEFAHVPRFMVNSLLNHRFPWKTHIAARDGFWSVPVVLTYIRVGDLVLFAVGAEVFTEIGMSIKQASPSSYTLFASLSSGCIGYLPTRTEHGQGGYEVDLSPYFYRMPGRLKADSADRVLVAVKGMTGTYT